VLKICHAAGLQVAGCKPAAYITGINFFFLSFLNNSSYMKKTALLFVAATIACMAFIPHKKDPLPDPNIAARKVMAALQKNDTVAYKQLMPTFADLMTIINRIVVSAGVDESLIRGLQDSATMEKNFREKMSDRIENFKKIYADLTADSVDWNDIAIIDFYYEIEKEKLVPVTQMKGTLLFKSGGRDYNLRLRDFALVGDQWLGPDMSYLGRNAEEKVEEIELAMPDSAVAAMPVDTAMVMPPMEEPPRKTTSKKPAVKKKPVKKG
jgi:hypothetical protein